MPTDDELQAAADELFNNVKNAGPDGIPTTTPPDDDTEDDDIEDEEDGADESGGDEGAGDDDSDEGAADHPGPTESGTEPPPTAPVAADEIVLADGTRFTRDDAINAANLARFLESNPHVAEAMRQAALQQQQQAQPTQPQAPTPPDGLDLEDPAIRAMWELYEDQSRKLTQAQEVLQQHDQQIAYTTQSALSSLYNNARNSFAEESHLDSDKIARVEQVVGNLNLIERYMQPYDPVTGQQREVDPARAVHDAFTAGLALLPDVREASLRDMQQERDKSRRRKAKASSLSGARGGSTRHQPTNPIAEMSMDEKVSAMAAELEQMMSGE